MSDEDAKREQLQSLLYLRDETALVEGIVSWRGAGLCKIDVTEECWEPLEFGLLEVEVVHSFHSAFEAGATVRAATADYRIDVEDRGIFGFDPISNFESNCEEHADTWYPIVTHGVFDEPALSSAEAVDALNAAGESDAMLETRSASSLFVVETADEGSGNQCID